MTSEVEDAIAKRRARLAAEQPPIPAVVIDKIAAKEPPVETPTQHELKPSWKSVETWLAILLPVIVGAVVEAGWLTEQTAKEVGIKGGVSFIVGRQLLKAVKEWKR